MDITYDIIEPLLVHADIEGSELHCQFRTQSGQIVDSSAHVRRLNTVGSQVTRSVKTIVVNRSRSQAASLVRGILGGGILGSAAASVIRNVSNPAHYGYQFSDEEKEAAVVEAFKKVQGYFRFDEQASTWKAPAVTPATDVSKLTTVEQRLHKSPLVNNFDKEILARLLVELAGADGEIGPEERTLLAEIIPPALGSLQQLALRDPVSPVEFREVSPSAKETIYTTAWVMALTDQDLSAAEENLLAEYAEMFGFSAARAGQLARDARLHALEKNIHPQIGRSELFEAADRLGISQEDAEMCLIQLKRKT